jgi:hypothetical protein
MKTYALLIGLNEYLNKGIKPLNGCVNDINRFEEYLLSSLYVPQSQILKLLDRQATKTAIVAAFQSHFANAKKEDVCIVYFAGHGVLQYANPILKADSINDKLECITCYDTNFDGKNLIADKEQRWLIYQLTIRSRGCHILTIYDCCHSGDNTRAVGESTVNERTIRVTEGANRGSVFVMPQRVWSDFIFSQYISERDVANAWATEHKLDNVLPQGKHIQLAACASNETAKEGFEGGYFSSNLMDLLESTNGKMTYYDIRSLIYRRLSNLPPEKQQTPQFYAFEGSIFQPFLGGAAQNNIQATVNFNTKKDRWEMSAGTIYGMYKGATVFVILPHKNNEVEAAVVKEVFHDCSVLTFSIEDVPAEQEKPDAEKRIRRTDTNYKASVGKFMQKELKVACVSASLSATWINFCKKNTILLENASIKAVSNSADADYVVNTEGSKLFIAQPNAAARPLVEMIDDTGLGASFDKLIAQLTAASRWEFVKTQTSEADNASLLDNIAINFTWKGKTDNLMKTTQVTCPITNYQTQKYEQLNYCEQMRIQIVNNHPTDTLYISGIWLSELFGIDPTILKGMSTALAIEPTKSVNVYDETFNLIFGDNIFKDKWDKFSNYLKVYVSTSPFELTQFQQMDLEHPRKEVKRIDEDIRLSSKNTPPFPKLPQWAVKTVAFDLDVSKLTR